MLVSRLEQSEKENVWRALVQRHEQGPVRPPTEPQAMGYAVILRVQEEKLRRLMGVSLSGTVWEQVWARVWVIV